MNFNARHLHNHRICFVRIFRDLKFLPGFALEGFPNRDSTQYIDHYGLGMSDFRLKLQVLN